MPLGSQSKASSETLTVKKRRNTEWMVICTKLRFRPSQFTVRLSNSPWETKKNLACSKAVNFFSKKSTSK